jgi:4-hydroxy-3-methylbut-2-enyl diphosphate reductase
MMNTVVEIDSESGFCSGVRHAVRLAEEELKKSGKLFCLGELVHNRPEQDRLKALGLRHIDYDEFSKLQNVKVLIRAHGEAPWVYETARKNHIEILDATCPIVAKLQARVRADYNSQTERGESLVIYGKHDHPEVRALVGQTDGKAVVISTISELDGIDLNKPVHVYSQTTMNQEDYLELTGKLSEKIRNAGGDPSELLQVNNSICNHVSHRKARLETFATLHDIILLISSRESSNGRMLYNYCKSINPSSYFITDIQDLENIRFDKSLSVGICGATSTPYWQLNEIRSIVNERLENN